MRAIVLAGSSAYEDGASSSSLPRALWPVLMRPLLVGLIERLQQCDVTAVSICANGHTELYTERLGREAWELDELRFSNDTFPRGPAGCLKDNADFIDDEPFVVAGAACWFSDDLSDLRVQHRRHGNELTVCVVPETHRPAGLYICEASILDCIPDEGYFDIKEQLVSRLRSSGRRVGALPLRGFTGEVVDPASYLSVHHGALTNAVENDGDCLSSYTQITPGVWVGTGVSIASDVRMYGPVVLGASASIGKGAVLIGPTSIGPRARIGDNAVVAQSAVWEDAWIPAGASVDRAIVPPAMSRGGYVCPSRFSSVGWWS